MCLYLTGLQNLKQQVQEQEQWPEGEICLRRRHGVKDGAGLTTLAAGISVMVLESPHCLLKGVYDLASRELYFLDNAMTDHERKHSLI